MFPFRLQTLLRLRLAERDQRRADLAKALRAEEVLRAEDERLVHQQNEQAQASRELRAPGVANMDALLGSHRYAIVLANQRRQLATQLAQVEAETDRRRQALVEADRQVRVLEKLRERQARAQAAEAAKAAAKQFDELAALGFLRHEEAQT
jgi:flagellar export protein FliJ